ncbi:hypothetical protein OG936_21675 [Streptomyces sp. NBC_00846]|uniref:hypothetical protein n=1 Tax=Streptomyces sp. NBC_00846 TaxID=2975849 RepID=UPI003863DFD5|nr:hypothetical protein OG936_21675 [Streptomyces sp. NBC_00846]
MGAPDGQQPAVHLGSVTNSAFAIGNDNTVAQHHHHAAEPGDTHAELLRAVQDLRADLGRFVASDTTEILDAELVSVTDEIETTGTAAPGRLARLQEALTAAGALTSTLASGVAVGQAVAALLGG